MTFLDTPIPSLRECLLSYFCTHIYVHTYTSLASTKLSKGIHLPACFHFVGCHLAFLSGLVCSLERPESTCVLWHVYKHPLPSQLAPGSCTSTYRPGNTTKLMVTSQAAMPIRFSWGNLLTFSSCKQMYLVIIRTYAHVVYTYLLANDSQFYSLSVWHMSIDLLNSCADATTCESFPLLIEKQPESPHVLRTSNSY